jgi:hypothetical protein
VSEIEVPVPFDSEPTPAFSAEDVATLLADPEIQANLANLAEAHSYNGAAAGETKLGAEEEEIEVRTYGPLSEMEFIALMSSTFGFILLVAIIVIIRRKYTREQRERPLVASIGNSLVLGKGWGSEGSPSMNSIANPTSVAASSSVGWHSNASDGMSYFDVVPATQSNNQYDYDVDNMRIPEGSQFYDNGIGMMQGGYDMNAFNGSVGPDPAQMLSQIDYLENELASGANQGILLANDQEFFGQQFENPLHSGNTSGFADPNLNLRTDGGGGGGGWSAQEEAVLPKPEPTKAPINMEDVHTDPATGQLYTVDNETGETRWLDDDDASSIFTTTESDFTTGGNPMNVLLDNDQKIFGQQFQNPLHSSAGHMFQD